MSTYQNNTYHEWITQLGSSVDAKSSGVDKASVIETFYKFPTEGSQSQGLVVDDVINPSEGQCIEEFRDTTYHFVHADLTGYPISFKPNFGVCTIDSDLSLAIAKPVQEIRDLNLNIIEVLEQNCNNSIDSIVMGNALRSWSKVLRNGTDSVVIINRESNSKLPSGEYTFDYQDLALTVRRRFYRLIDNKGNHHLYGLFRDGGDWVLKKQNNGCMYVPRTEHISYLTGRDYQAKVILSVVTSNRRNPKERIGDCVNVNTDECAELVR